MCRSVWAAAAPTAQARPNLCFHNMLFLITLALASVFAQVAGTCDITVFTKSWQCSCGGKAREVSRGCWWESGRRMWCEDQLFARRVQWTNTFPKILVGFCTILVVSLLLSAAREWLWSSSYCTIRPWCDFFFGSHSHSAGVSSHSPSRLWQLSLATVSFSCPLPFCPFLKLGFLHSYLTT